MRRILRTDETGERVLVDRVKRTRPWYWMSVPRQHLCPRFSVVI